MLIAIAAISLVVAGIGIMNIMPVSYTHLEQSQILVSAAVTDKKQRITQLTQVQQINK